MSRRTIIIILIIIGTGGLVFLVPPNPYTDPVAKPVRKLIKSLGSQVSNDLDIPMPAEETKVYKWQDKKGDWHFSNTEPPSNVDSESKIYKSDENVVPAIKTEK